LHWTLPLYFIAIKMKLLSLLITSSCLTANAFVSAKPSQKSAALKPAFRKESVVQSPLFRDPTKVRGGAVPGWASYNKALDTNPLTAKALTSLVGWALGDFLAQVRFRNIVFADCSLGT
jgi:hypothetical protein